MSDTTDTSIEIMGKMYQIKCPETEINSLQRAAQYLEEKMRLVRASGILSLDRIAIITALNMAHQLLMLEQQKNQHAQIINQRLTELQNKVESVLGSVDNSLAESYSLPDFKTASKLMQLLVK